MASPSSKPDLSILNLFSIKGKIALVTGGASGVGNMIASSFVANGAKVYIASRKEKELKKATEELNSMGPGTCEYVVADISSKAGCDALCSVIKAKEPKLHILVNNSGVSWSSPYEKFPEKEGWDRVLSVNVKSLFYMTVGLTELLAKDSTSLDPARVINISSVASIDAKVNDTDLAPKGWGLWSYNTSKAAVNHLTTTMAVTLGPRFITVNAILPGVFPSRMTTWGFQNDGDKKIASQHPMGRMGSPTDMAGIALFLSSKAGAHLSGNHILADGGAFWSGMGYSRL